MKIVAEKQQKYNLSLDEKLINVFSYIAFALLAFLCAYPFYYLIICTISDNALVDAGKIIFWPQGINFDNYKKVFDVQYLWSSLKNSVLRTIVGTGLSLFVTSYVAYFFTKTEMWGRKFWYRFCVITMYFSAGLIPHYLTRRMLGLNNTFWIYIIPGCLGVYNMVLVKTSIEAMPASLEESAYLDGAGFFTRFFRIVIPLQKPILATIGLFDAVGHWNDFFTTKLYITSPRLYTIQFVLYEMLTRVQSIFNSSEELDRFAYVSPTGVRMTLTAVTIIPIMCVYPLRTSLTS